jgi:hypothetical protein
VGFVDPTKKASINKIREMGFIGRASKRCEEVMWTHMEDVRRGFAIKCQQHERKR